MNNTKPKSLYRKLGIVIRFYRIVLMLGMIIYADHVHGQNKAIWFDEEKIDTARVQQLFNQKLNAHRKELGLKTLAYDHVLFRAAKDHADYLAKHDTLTHQQTTAGRQSPSKRVAYFKGTHDMIGENCLMIPVHTPLYNESTGKTYTVDNYDQLATQLFEMWKNSKGHYANMINEEYEAEGLSLSYIPTNKRVYVAQVFAKKAYTYAENLHALIKTYSFKERDDKLCKPVDEVQGLRLANRVIQQNGKFYLFLQNIEILKKAFNKPGDQIALDIIFRDQFTCKGDPMLNGSPHYDGILLKPVDFVELYKKNEGIQGRLLAPICDIPESLIGKDFQVNVLLIRQSCLCEYQFPVEVESQDYPLIDLEPLWELSEEKVLPGKFNTELTTRIYFEYDNPNIDSKLKSDICAEIGELAPYVKKVSIQVFGSIEGDSTSNDVLNQHRIGSVKSMLNQCLKHPVIYTSSYTENWDDFLIDIQLTDHAYLANWDKPAVKAFFKDTLAPPFLLQMLATHRYVDIRLELAGTYYATSSGRVLHYGISEALKTYDYQKAHVIQSEIIRKYMKQKTSLEEISDFELDSLAKDLPFIINLLAAKCLNPYDELFLEKHAMESFFKKFSHNTSAQYNYSIYAINYMAMTMDTIIHPERLQKMVDECAKLAPVSIVNTLRLNFELAAVQYYTYINQYSAMVKHLEMIKTLFGQTTFNEGTAYKLAMYFSHYNSLDWAVELLEPYLEKNTEERFNHLYIAAGSIVLQDDYPNTYLKYLDRYVKKYPKEFKKWIDENYQLLRSDLFRDYYCHLK